MEPKANRSFLSVEQRKIIDELIADLPLNLTSREAMALLRVSRNQLTRLIQSHELVPLRRRKGSGKLTFPRPAIRRYLERCMNNE